MKECQACRHCFPDHFNNCPTDGSELTSSIAGDTILDGRYQLERRLGQGGMGIVYRARHVFLKTPYAIKVILPDLVGNDPMLATRFRQEAMVAARIGHRNIVNVTDFGVVGGKMPYLVMDLIKGRSLHDLLAAEGRLGMEPALEIMTALCAGVGAAHRQGIVHRDLKPLNVMLQDEMPLHEAVKVLDFGLAKIKSGELLGSFVAAQTTGLMGSPYYMAPELWSDDEPDARADIYSLGVILYQMLAGDVPFKGPSLPAIMKKHMSDPPPRFIERGVSVAASIEAVVDRALAKKREDRMSSVEQFISELRAAVETARVNMTQISGEVTRDLGAATVRYVVDTERTIIETEGSLGHATWDTQSPPPTESQQQRIEDEADRLAREFEEAQRRADEARLRAEEAKRKRAEEEAARKKAEEEAARKVAEEEAARRRAEEQARKREEEQAARRRAEAEAAQRLIEEEARQKAEEEEARRRAAEEATRLAREVAEAKERAEEARLIAESEARKRSEEAVARQRAEEEAHRLAQEVAEAQQRAEQARIRAQEEAEKRAREEEERRKAEEEEDRLRAEESIRLQAEGEEAKRKAAEESERLAREIADAQQRADEARLRAEEEAQRRVEAQAALERAEEEARKLAEQMEEVQRRAEEARKRSEEEAARRAEQEEQRRIESEKEREQLLAYAQQLSQDPSNAIHRSAPPSGFHPSSGFNSAAINEETVVRTGHPSLHPLSGQSIPIDPASSVSVPKKSLALPVIAGIGAVVVIAVIAVVAILYSTGKLGGTSSTNQPAVTTTTATPSTPSASPPVSVSFKPESIKIDGGSFLMGLANVPTKEPYDLGQTPARTVNVKTFWMDKTEVTNGEYAEFVAGAKHPAPSYWSNGKPPSGQELWPVTNVSVADAQAFSAWRSKRDGRKYRLPTEEEWEYAARNGSANNLYPWGNEWIDGRANIDANALKPVGSYPQGASKAGIMDLIGNAWEWTSSKAVAYPGNTLLAIPSGQVIIRGGAFVEPSRGPEAISATRRSWVPPTDKQAAIGFRLVRE